MKVFESISELIGNTPIVRLNSVEKNLGLKAAVYAKVEAFNPAGSAKDRVGLQMVLDAEKAGILKRGSVIIEAGSYHHRAHKRQYRHRAGFLCSLKRL